jgi:hypothetical protein
VNRRAGGAVARIPALALVGLLAAGLVVAEGGASRTRPRIPTLASAVDGPIVPAADAVSVVWFCSEGSALDTGRALETILIANLELEPIEVTITVMRGADHSFAVEQRQIAPLAQERVAVADLAEVEEPGVVVEVLGGRAVVEHELRSASDIAIGPCARASSGDWYFAAGTTVRGAEEWLTLFNPFGEDAIVDVEFLTAAGRSAPGATEALAVPRRSRISVPVHEHVLREEAVAIGVHTRIGRVVAERTLRFDGTDGRAGVAVSLGVTDAARRWRIPVTDGQVGSAQGLSIANFTHASAQVEISIELPGETEVEPQTIDVAGQSVERIDFAQRVPAGTTYAIDVRVTRGAPVVVETFGSWVAPAPFIGVATMHGSVTTARRWAMATGRLDDTTEAVISAVNVSGRPVTVQLYVYTAGDPNSPVSTPARALEPGQRGEFRFTEIQWRADQVIVVQADGPIVVGRLVLGAGASMSAAIPDPEA